MKYRKKSVVVEVFQVRSLDEQGIKVARMFCPDLLKLNDTVFIPTLEGAHIVSQGDYIIKGVAGEFYPCKPDIFVQTYELVE